MIVDCHVHLIRGSFGGCEKAEEILRAMDEAKIDKIFLFSPFPVEIQLKGRYLTYKLDQEKQKESLKKVTKIVAENPERLIGFAWIDPLLPHAENEVERAIVDYKLQGIKLIPNHWYPYEERIFPVYAKIQQLKVPIIFHSGILFCFKDSSRFCRPAFYEVLLHFPEIKFALAHIGWPWTDECIATAGRFEAALRLQGLSGLRKGQNKQNMSIKESQMFVDITPGTPPIYRTDALRKAIAYLGEDKLIYGSDASTTQEGIKMLKEVLKTDKRIFNEELELSREAQEKITGINAMRLLRD